MDIKIRDKISPNDSGFTLIEILVVIGIIAVLAAVVLVAVNPARQFKLARDSQRISNVNSILNAIDQNMAEHEGIFSCNNYPTPLPTATTSISSMSVVVDPRLDNPPYVNIAPCIIPAYISAMPFDPVVVDAHYGGPDDYDSGYYVSQDDLGRVTVSAIGEINTAISVTR